MDLSRLSWLETAAFAAGSAIVANLSVEYLLGLVMPQSFVLVAVLTCALFTAGSAFVARRRSMRDSG